MPNILFLASPSMHQQYQWFHDCVRFDITYALCRFRDSKNKAWGFGIFSGFMESLSPCIFGLCFIKNEGIEDFEILWKMFFDNMKLIPQSIITDEQGTIITALENIKR